MAGTLALKPPPPDFNDHKLDIVSVLPQALCRVSRRKTDEPYFGKSGACRFDDNNPDIKARFRTAYLGFDYAVAFAESVLHNAEPVNGRFLIPTSDIETRLLISFKGRQTLQLANMTGTHLLRAGGNGEISGTADYTLPQAWAAAIAAHPAQVDGMIYMSRRINDSPAVALFARPDAPRPPIALDRAIPLFHHPEYAATMKALAVSLI